MKITLNLATRPYADQGPALKRLRMGMLVLAVVLAGLVFGLTRLHQAALRMAAEEDRVDQSIARIQREEQGYQAQMRQPANARVLQQAQFLNALFDEKDFSWTAAMEDLEQVLPGGVQVTAIEPSRGKDGRITLHLRISGPRERSVMMVRNMEHSRRFVSPRISGENAENTQQGGVQAVVETGPGKVAFDLLAEYSPATLAERKAELAGKRGRSADGEGGRGDSAPRASRSVKADRGVKRQPKQATPPAGMISAPGYIAPNPRPGAMPIPSGNPNVRRLPNGMPMPQTHPQPGGPQ